MRKKQTKMPQQFSGNNRITQRAELIRGIINN